MRIGCRLPRFSDPLGEAVGQVAVAADRLGFDSLWIDAHVVLQVHVASEYPLNAERRQPFNAEAAFPDPFSMLAYAAALTRRVRLATAVVPLLSTDPLSLAKQAATLDALSHGRLELGLGAGWLKEEAQLRGHPTDHPTGRLAEAIDLMRAAWRDGLFEWHGRFYDVPPAGIFPMPPQRDGIPLWIGGIGQSAVRIALDRGAGLILGGNNLSHGVAVKQRLAAEGRTLPIGISLRLTGKPEDWLAAAEPVREGGIDLLVVAPDRDEAGYPDQLATFVERVMPCLS
jgi:probable F420-dependent oxidoreductase